MGEFARPRVTAITERRALVERVSTRSRVRLLQSLGQEPEDQSSSATDDVTSRDANRGRLPVGEFHARGWRGPRTTIT